MTFKNLKELNTTESRSCALVFNFNNKELIKIKSVFRLSGISDIIILKNDNLNTTIKDILDDNLLEDSEEKINSRAIIFNNIESRKISAVSDNLKRLKVQRPAQKPLLWLRRRLEPRGHRLWQTESGMEESTWIICQNP